MQGSPSNPLLIDRAFILAAGLGTRLRPLTDDRPKPMVAVAGRPIIDHVLDRLAAAGVREIAVNLHYKPEMLQHHLQQKMSDHPNLHFHFLPEPMLLETGGGLRNGLQHMGEGPFYAVSGDSFWTEGPGLPALERLRRAWDPARMDLLLLLQPLSRMTVTAGRGDYDLAADGRCILSPAKTGAYMWTSIRVCSKKLFEGAPAGAFSFLELMKRAEETGRVYGLAHDGAWFHVSTPEDLAAVNAALAPAQKRDGHG